MYPLQKKVRVEEERRVSEKGGKEKGRGRVCRLGTGG